MRDFMASRVVDGRQQIRTAITFHEYGRLVMWPYGYTYTNVPADMTMDDHAALMTIGKHMAATNGYKPEQASDLYISSGTTRDYLYGIYRIFSYTFELSVKDYPDDSLIAAETGRNKEAVLYLMERAWCPLSVRGATVTRGPLRRLRRRPRGPPRLDGQPGRHRHGAGDGRFARSNPADTTYDGPKQLGTTPSGSMALVTGAAGRGQRQRVRPRRADVDPLGARIQLPATARPAAHLPVRLRPRRKASSADRFRAIVEAADGTQTVVFTVVGKAVDVDGVWRTRLDLDGPVGRPDHPPPVRGRRRRLEQPRRGRDRRRPDHPRELTRA